MQAIEQILENPHVGSIRQLLEGSRYSVVREPKGNVAILDRSEVKVADITVFRRSVLIEVPSALGSIVLELYPDAFEKIFTILKYADSCPIDSLYLMLFDDYERQMRIDEGKRWVECKGYRIHAVKGDGAFRFCLNVRDQSYMVCNLNALRVMLSLEEITIGRTWPMFVI